MPDLPPVLRRFLWEAMFRLEKLLFMNMLLTRSWMYKRQEQYQKRIRPTVSMIIERQKRPQCFVSMI